MKKMQTLGKALTKEQQMQISGGEWRFNRPLCVCNDSSTCFPCVEANCAGARAYAMSACCLGAPGGIDFCYLTCSNCE